MTTPETAVRRCFKCNFNFEAEKLRSQGELVNLEGSCYLVCFTSLRFQSDIVDMLVGGENMLRSERGVTSDLAAGKQNEMHIL